MSVHLGDLELEFDAFDDVPAGAIRLANGDTDTPQQLHRRKTLDSICLDASNLARRDVSSELKSTLASLQATPTFTQHMASLVRDLTARVKIGAVVDSPPGFMRYSNLEVLQSRFINAISQWHSATPDAPRFSVSVYAIGEAYLVTTLDRLRQEHRQETQAALRHQSSGWVTEICSKAWPGQVEQVASSAAARAKARPRV